MEILLGVWVVSGFFSAYIAGQKNRSTGGWFLLGLLFGIFALIAIAGVPAIEETPQEMPENTTPPSQTGEKIVVLFGLLGALATGGILFWYLLQ